MEEDIEQEVQCLGVSGYPRQCLYAVEAILDSNSLPDKATIVTYVKDRRNLQEEHLFLFWNWCSVPLTIVRNGFASGYTGDGPRSFSLAICMIRSKGIPIEGVDANEREFRLLDEGKLSPELYKKLKVESEPLTWPWPLWVYEEHERLLAQEVLWNNLGWTRTKGEIETALDIIHGYHPLVWRKLKLATRQSKESAEIEEGQQVGILLRDAWIEFTQKLFAEKSTDNSTNVKADDVKAMMRKLVKDDKTYALICSAWDLAVKVQHDRNISLEVARWCTLMTVLSMALLLATVEVSEKPDATYYKCPLCGSLKLSKVTEGIPDFDGHPVPMTFVECSKCGWRIPDF
ncbi:MAG: hypothetical protein MUP49_06905 [Dehalococcoidia bacterium]|nr:hypothetical protein [Dehalococcoidia bacterium]